MKKFLTGLRYGNWLTRLYVLSIPICILLAVGLIVVSFCVNIMYLFLLGVAFGIAAIALNLNFTVEEELVKEEPVSIPDDSEQNTIEQKDTELKDTEQKDMETAEVSTEEKDKQKPKKDKHKTKKEKRKKEKRKRKNEKQQLNPEESEAKKEDIAAYDEKKLKQVFYKYKVRKDYRTIMIDEWKEKEIHQSPAYIWTHRGQLHLLIISDGIQELTIPVNKCTTLLYQRGVICQAKHEYLQFRKENLWTTIFSPHLPIYHEGNKNGRPVIYKNLFEFGSGIRVTNTSAKNLMDLLQAEIQVDDIVTRDLRYNPFFKEVYKVGIMFREQLITAKEYQEKINDILQNLALSDASEQEYDDTLQLLCQHKLITQEYITYYKQYRERLKAEEQNSKQDMKGKNKIRKQKK